MYIVIILALILTFWPIVKGILRIISILVSGAFTLFGTLLFIGLAILGIVAAFMTGPPGWIIGGIVTVMFLTTKD